MGPADVLLGRVLRLGCPAAANLHHGPLLLSPGAVRLEIIEWLFERFDPALSPASSRLGIAASRVETLLRHGTTIAVCGPDDLGLIEGTANEEGQFEFLTLLVELVELATEHFPDPNATSSTLDHDLQQDASLMATLSREDLEPILTPMCELLPPDLMHECPRSKRSDRDLASLEMRAVALKRQLDVLHSTLREGADSGGSAAGPNTEHQIRTIAVFLDTCAQQIDDVVRSSAARFPVDSDNGERQAQLIGIGSTADLVLKELLQLEGRLTGVSEVVNGVQALGAIRVKPVRSSQLDPAKMTDMADFIRVMDQSRIS